MGWIILFVIVAAIGLGIVVAVGRSRQIGALAARGVPATATVTRRFLTGKGGAGSAVKRIGYAYTGPDGQRYERFASVTAGRWREVDEGEDFPIVLLPEAPGTSAPAWLVDQAREALAKRGR